jgi:hypothetical protein
MPSRVGPTRIKKSLSVDMLMTYSQARLTNQNNDVLLKMLVFALG